MRESRSYGSVRGGVGDRYPYRDLHFFVGLLLALLFDFLEFVEGSVEAALDAGFEARHRVELLVAEAEDRGDHVGRVVLEVSEFGGTLLVIGGFDDPEAAESL